MSHAGTTRGLATDGERYERIDRIATGGMGEVWRARDTVLGREVAVKVLKREYAEDPTFRQRFAAEARHAASLHHPGIASIFDYGVLEDGTPFLVMELVDGRPLSELLAGGKVLDPEQARALVGQAAEALGVAHRAGVVHRDVKPANLLVTPDGQVKITDFGIARAADSANITHTGQIVGTPHYLSPEQAEGRAATAASDVYALGVLLFECLTGVRPFVADTPVAIALAHLRQDVPPLPAEIPPDLAAVTRRALAKDPTERYADGAEFAAALRAASAAPVAADATRVLDTGDLPAPEERTRPLGAAAAAVAAAPAAAASAVAPALRDRSRWPLYVAGALAALLVLVLLVAHPWSDDSTGDNGSTPTASAGQDVTVRRAAYVGEPVAQARRQLRRLGLDTTTSPATNDGSHTQGTVADLFPTGKVQRGDTVRLQVWGAAPTSAPPSTSAPATSSPPQHHGPAPEKEKGQPKGGDKSKGKGKKG